MAITSACCCSCNMKAEHLIRIWTWTAACRWSVCGSSLNWIIIGPLRNIYLNWEGLPLTVFVDTLYIFAGKGSLFEAEHSFMRISFPVTYSLCSHHATGHVGPLWQLGYKCEYHFFCCTRLHSVTWHLNWLIFAMSSLVATMYSDCCRSKSTLWQVWPSKMCHLAVLLSAFLKPEEVVWTFFLNETMLFSLWRVQDTRV